MNQAGLWDDTDGFFYDLLRLPDGTAVPLRIHSMVGLLPMLPAVVVPAPGDRARGSPSASISPGSSPSAASPTTRCAPAARSWTRRVASR